MTIPVSIPIGLFKFIEAKLLERYMIDRTIALGSFDYYRTLENFGRADRLEGRRESYVIDDRFRPDILEDRAALARMGVVTEGAGLPAFRMINCTAEVGLPPAYVFCCSLGPLDIAWELARHNSSPPPDYALRIRSLRAFMNGIERSIVVDTVGGSSREDVRGLATNRILRANTFGDVRYIKSPRDARDDHASPLEKPVRYSWEREFRFVLDPIRQLPPLLIVRLPSIGGGYFEIVRRAGA